MANTPDYQDAQLILRLYELRREDLLRKARGWFTESFRPKTLQELQALCPRGSQENAFFRMVVSYWEMAASFVVRGVVHKELFFDNSGELLFVWARVVDLVEPLRELRGAQLLSSLETVALEYIQHRESTSPGWWERFRAEVVG